MRSVLILAFVMALIAGRVRRARKAAGRHALHPGPAILAITPPVQGERRRRHAGQGMP